MRVCFVTHRYPPATGGVSLSARRIARNLARGGVEAHVAVLAAESGSRALLDDCTDTEVVDGVTVHRIEVRDDKTRLQRMFHALSALQRRQQFEVLCGFFLLPGALVATMVGRRYGVPTVSAIRGNDIGRCAFLPDRYPHLEYILRNSDAVTSVAQDLLDLADTIAPVAARARVIHNALDPDVFRRDGSPIEIPLKGPVVGSLGVFKTKKGIDYLVGAVSELAQDRDVSLLLVGPFKEDEDARVLRERLDRSCLRDRYLLTGPVAHEAIHGYLARFDVFVIPSLFGEGCPSALLEAMACGLPIVGTEAGAIPEILTDGHSGLLAQPGSTEDLRRAVGTLLDDPPLRERLGANAADDVKRFNLSWEQAAWRGLFEDVRAAGC